MAYQRRAYPTVAFPTPQPIDVVGQLRDLAQLAQWQKRSQRVEQVWAEEDKTRASKEAVEAAYNQSKGNIPETIRVLESQGRYAEASTFREKQQEIEEAQREETTKAVTAVGERLEGLKTTAAQGSELLQSLAGDPTLYPRLVPKLRDLAGSIDPRLAQEIPDQYDPTRLQGMVQFASELEALTDGRTKAIAAVKEKLAGKKAAKENLDLDRQIVGAWFGVSPDQNDWDQSMEYAQQLGVSDEALAKIGPTWSVEAVARARSLAIGPKEPAREPSEPLVPVEGPEGPVYAPRSGAVGKKVPVPAPRPAAVNIGSAERWKEAQMVALARERREGLVDEVEYAQRVAAIDASYKRQIGQGTTERPLEVQRHPPDWTPESEVMTMADLSPDLLAQVQELLRANGLMDDEENINNSLAGPENRQALGLTKR